MFVYGSLEHNPFGALTSRLHFFVFASSPRSFPESYFLPSSCELNLVSSRALKGKKEATSMFLKQCALLLNGV